MYSKNQTDSISPKLQGPSQFKKLMERKIELLRQYLSITELLNSQLDFDDLGLISQLLNKREIFIQNIIKIEGQIRELEDKETFSSKVLFNAEEEKHRIYELLKRIEDVEKKCLAKLSYKFNYLRKEISEKQRALKNTKLYLHQSSHRPRFLDVRR